MSVEEDTADELGRCGVEDELDKLRDAAEGDIQVDLMPSNCSYRLSKCTPCPMLRIVVVLGP